MAVRILEKRHKFTRSLPLTAVSPAPSTETPHSAGPTQEWELCEEMPSEGHTGESRDSPLELSDSQLLALSRATSPKMTGGLPALFPPNPVGGL